MDPFYILRLLGLPVPQFPARAPVTEPIANLDARRRLHAIATELDNFNWPDSQQMGWATVDSMRSRVQAWFDTVRVASSDTPELSLPTPGQARVYYREDSPLVDNNEHLPRPLDLFTWEEVYSNKASYIPPLIIRPDDIAGPRRIVSGEDGYFYYDPDAVNLNAYIQTLSIPQETGCVNLEDPEFFKKHAVRVFMEVTPVLGVMDDPMYRYQGDFYVQKTDEYLPTDQWAELREEVKDRIIHRFMDRYKSRIDGQYRRPECCYTTSQIRHLYDRGNMLPYVILLHAGNIAFAPSEQLASPPIPSFVHWPNARKRRQPFIPYFPSNVTFDLEPVLHDISPAGDQILRSRFSVSTEGSAAENEDADNTSPGPDEEGDNNDHGDNNGDQDDENNHDDRSQLITLHPSHHCYHSIGADPEPDSDDDSEEIHTYECDLPHPTVQLSTGEVEETEPEYEGDNDPDHPINAHTPLRFSSFFVARLMESSYEDIQRFRTSLENSEAETEEGVIRHGILQILEGNCELTTLPGGSVMSSPLVSFGYTEESDDGGSEVVVGVGIGEPDEGTERLTMAPYFPGLQP